MGQFGVNRRDGLKSESSVVRKGAGGKIKKGQLLLQQVLMWSCGCC